MSFMPLLLIFIPIISSTVIYLSNNKRVNYLVYPIQLTVTILNIMYFGFYKELSKPHKVLLGGWEQGIGITLKNDNLSIIFMFLTIFIWWMVILFCWTKYKYDSKFLFFLLFLEGVFLALIQANDFFTLFVLFEISSIISTILIIFQRNGRAMLAGLYYLLFSSAGMLFYLIGVTLLYNISGSLNMDTAMINIADLKDSYVMKMSYIFLISGISVKAAFFPIFSWLPKAHSTASTSISALLSGLLVKAGIYAYIRVSQVFYLEVFREFFFFLGLITAISGVIFALSQKDIKQILSFHTISQVGIILIGVSHMEGSAFVGGILHTINHALFKSLLFMCAGLIIKAYKTRDVSKIRGVYRNFPILSTFMIVGMLSITGAPMFNGYISKTMIKYGITDSMPFQILLFISNLGTSVSFVKMSQIFLGKSKAIDKQGITKSTLVQYIPLVLLSLACILLGNHYLPIVNYLSSLEVSYIDTTNLFNGLGYIMNLAIALFIYKLFIDRDHLIIRKVRNIQISFNTSNILLVCFIFVMILWTGLFS